MKRPESFYATKSQEHYEGEFLEVYSKEEMDEYLRTLEAGTMDSSPHSLEESYSHERELDPPPEDPKNFFAHPLRTFSVQEPPSPDSPLPATVSPEFSHQGA